MSHIVKFYRKSISGRLKAFWIVIMVTAMVLTLCAVVVSPRASAVQDLQKSEQPTLQPSVKYDFSSMRAGDHDLANLGSQTNVGHARLLDEHEATASAIMQDGALAMQGNYYVKLPNGLLSNHSSVTISTVVKNDAFNASGPWTYLWSLGGTGQASKGSWAVSTHTSLYTSITSQGNGAGETFFSASRNVSMSDYQTLTATIDGTNNEVTLYIDGSVVGSSKATVNPAQFGDQTHNVIGQSRYPGVGDALFHGGIKAFAIYDRVLTPMQIAQSLQPDGVGRLLDEQLHGLTLPSSAIDDFALPATTPAAQLSWTSSDPSIITIDADRAQARVHQSSSDQQVTLTARAQPLPGMAQPSRHVTRAFQVLVPQRVGTDGLASKIADAIQVERADDVRGDFLLPARMSLPAYHVEGRISWKSSDPNLVRPQKPIAGSQTVAAIVHRPDCGTARSVVLTATVTVPQLAKPVTKQVQVSLQPLSAGADSSHVRTSSHDPSIVKANGKYYIFGSHRAWARSTDLQHWEPFTNNLSTDYERIFAPIWNSWPKQASNPDVAGNMWAPEVIWNTSMSKWCMYMSINGGGFPYQKSVMVLLTADDIEGDWTYVGPVIYSGFQASNAGKTDVLKVLGQHPDLTRYSSLEDTGLNMIDACVKYDENGDLWMSFGSWFGGIWMIKLDKTTGLRDYDTKYPTQANVSDAYYGHKLAGGYGNSGEGSALVKHGNWWYLMLSYGGLTQTGGYQMREFRSRSITGPYLDQNGNPAIYTRKLPDDKLVNRGLRIMSSVHQTGQHEVMTAQGGNALLTEADGSIFNVYHSRFVRTSGNQEEHQVRVNQMLATADGWLVSSPYEYSGKLGAVTEASSVPGEYEFVVHNPTSFYAGGTVTAAGINQTQQLVLKADGSLGGVAKGRWEIHGSNLKLHVSGSSAMSGIHGNYELAIATQVDEYNQRRIVLSGVGGDVFTNAGSDVPAASGAVAVWGSRILGDSSSTPVPCSVNDDNHGNTDGNIGSKDQSKQHASTIDNSVKEKERQNATGVNKQFDPAHALNNRKDGYITKAIALPVSRRETHNSEHRSHGLMKAVTQSQLAYTGVSLGFVIGVALVLGLLSLVCAGVFLAGLHRQ
ncbi:family 43 glycosylhydrolase [Bombiscardovia coagulans]|uniref:Fused endo-1,5-alpha-L-arabinosidase and LamG-containing protein n=1 Tax=Bombiscardovia coagulans TaxID=686666 RepID=A0A261EU59_9BIFI|nr:family 43 glycosylhydrolase [Bombiscardovia coagulans]OZG50393.1 fused endo-1,5-alpha-L-arabinosidase and LamG-containing protein [Bombiscardovia coagulans]